MKKLVLAIAIFPLFSFVAYAAPPPPPVFSWTGFYIGGNIGYGWANDDPGTISLFDPIGVPVGSIAGINAHLGGVIGGGQLGYNQQINNIVLGVEGDFSGTGIQGSITDPVNDYTASTKINWLSTVRGRAGFAFDRFMVYATGGLAVASVKTTLNDYYPPIVVTSTSTPTYVGWAIGGGIEMELYRNWTATVEYLYLDLGSKQNTFNEQLSFGFPAITVSPTITGNLVRVGLNYKFN